jgi:hypothetical protein
MIIIVIMMVSLVFSYPMKCRLHDGEMPINAVNYAYERMSDKLDVRFIDKHTYEEGLSIAFFVEDSENKSYRVQWSGVYNSLELNKPYDIRYQIYNKNNIDDKIWEIKENKTVI